MNDMESLLKSLVGHNVSLSFTVHEEGDLRDSEGVLMDFNEDFIHLKMFDNFGLTSDYYLNRHASTLHSITDFGKEKVSG